MLNDAQTPFTSSYGFLSWSKKYVFTDFLKIATEGIFDIQSDGVLKYRFSNGKTQSPKPTVLLQAKIL